MKGNDFDLIMLNGCYVIREASCKNIWTQTFSILLIQFTWT